MGTLEEQAAGELAARPAATEAYDQNTHVANAHRIANHYGDRLLYVEGIGWHTWGAPWVHDELGARRIAHGLGRIIAEEAAGMAPWVAKAANDDERVKRQKAMNNRFRWASQSENAANIKSSMGEAQTLLACKAAEMDANPMLLGLPSGVLDLSVGEYRDHRQDDFITKVAGADYIEGATAPTWQRFLGDVFANDADLLDYVQRLTGYALSGQRGEHLLPIFYGSGANGKSTFLTTVQSMLGEYAGTAAPGLLVKKHGSDDMTATSELHGRRLVVVSETGEAGKLNEDQAKALTGGDMIRARRLFQAGYDFKPTHMFALQTNHKPRVSGTDEGIWRRLRLIPFTVTIPANKRDPRLADKLNAELPGILQWALAGWRAYQAGGFVTPESVTAATSDYRSASDQVGVFLEDCCTVAPGFTAKASDLYRAYADWCKEAGEHPRTQREFGMRLAERGFERARSSGTHTWRGVSITTEPRPWVQAA